MSEPGTLDIDPLNVGVVSLFPEMFRALTDYGVTGRAAEAGIIRIKHANPRDFTTDRHRTVDDKPYGGGPGMVMKPGPLAAAVRQLQQDQALHAVPVIYLSPAGKALDQAAVERFSRLQGMVLVAGRYEGVDERFIETQVDEVWSVGDFVVSGGELPAMLLLDAVSRLLPGVLGDDQSATNDSFSAGLDGLLEGPQFTRPEEYEGNKVPPELLSGDHEKIRRWRLQQALGRTWQTRPELIQVENLNEEQRDLLTQYKEQVESRSKMI